MFVCASSLYLGQLLVGEVIGPRVMCFHFKENADRILLALLRPSPDALENLGDLFLRHDLTSSISGG
jgi:hypothetical protein